VRGEGTAPSRVPGANCSGSGFVFGLFGVFGVFGLGNLRVSGVSSPMTFDSGCDSGFGISIIVRVRAARAAASGLTPGGNQGIIESSLGLPLAQPPPCQGFSLPGA
jgi:hypothetical protein